MIEMYLYNYDFSLDVLTWICVYLILIDIL